MQLALEQARAAAALGEVPVGAVVVRQPITQGDGSLVFHNRDCSIDKATIENTREPSPWVIEKLTTETAPCQLVIASAHNRREIDASPWAHAEFLALMLAAQRLGRWRLTDCTVFVTLEPCVMCAGLMQQARIARCVYGARDPKAGALGSLYRINEDERLNHTIAVEAGVCEEESAELLRTFFAERRK
jgi:tRNA(adenine34) deaminase